MQHLEQLLEKKFKELEEIGIQQRSGHHSDLLREIQRVNKDLNDKIDTNTKLTEDIRNHPMFKAWETGKTMWKLGKWGGLAIIGASAVLVAIKNGGEVIRDIIYFLTRK